MRTAIYNKVMRVAALAIVAALAAPALQAQEALHLFYKNKTRETIEIKPDTKVEFYKKPYANIYYDTDTIHMSASSGRTFGLGHAEYNVDWNITTADEWLLTRKGNSPWELGDGMLQDYFVVYATANATDQRREGKVTVTSARAGLTKDIVVVQHPYMLTLDYKHMYSNYETAVIGKNVEIAWKDTSFYADVYPNHGVKVLSYPDWMTLKFISEGDDYCQFEDILKVESAQSAGTNSSSYAYFTFAQNDAATDRVGNIIFEAHGQTAVLTVTQKGLTEEAIVDEADELIDETPLFDNTGRHNDFGFPSLMLGMDSRGMDMVSEDIGYNWFTAWMSYEDVASNSVPTATHWTSLYNQILAANKVMEDYGEREGKSLFQFYLGQAYAQRAFNYFYLAQLYQQTYVGNEEQPCVPIITESDIRVIYTEGRARATVCEVYDFILADLDKAEHLLLQTAVARPGKGFVSADVVNGLRARVYMVMERWADACAEASKVIDNSGAVPYTRDEVAKPTFNDINHGAWLWGIDVEEDDRTVTSGICNWPSHMGSFSYGYAQIGAWRMVSRSLYDAIPTTDVRKGWFLNAEATSANLNAEQASYARSYGMYPYTQVKFAPENGVTIGTPDMSGNCVDIPLMRIEEMYLILAEAQAMMGDPASGAATLQNFVATYRDPAYTCKATTAEAVREAVWMQRRIELWGEGHSYFDLMRMKKGVDRRGAGFASAYVYNIPAGDAALIYPIPDREMSRNPLLIQNPVAEQPVPVSD
ncbi:MAG: RagB/SusD family nutrient uptake outer membrane protein [Bacteroidaceae bacterium]|nr:RagB/SusD family nutrient uptake outer membrane protein [Bacteroidaceae bacterium]